MRKDEVPETLGKAVTEGLKEGLGEAARSSVRWAFGGALVGAVLLGGLGLYHFGTPGLAVGAGVGAVVGGLGAWIFSVTALRLLD